MFENVFRTIQNAPRLSQWAPSPGLGRHRVALTSYKVKTSQKDQSQFPEVEFVILESEAEKVGEVRGIAWFINAPGHKGKYHAGRAQAFVEAIGQCFGDKRVGTADLWQIGEELAVSDKYVGTVLDVVATTAFKNGQPVKRDDGSTVLNYTWYPIPQTPETLAQTKAYVATLVPGKTAAPAPAAAPQAQYTAPATQPASAPQMHYQPPAAAPAPAPVQPSQPAQPAPTTAPSGMPAFLSKFGGG